MNIEHIVETKSLEQYVTQPLLKWYDQFGRKELPWQVDKDPYKIWISEIMLQQTQVQTVINYFTRFIQNFPTLEDLAHAPEDLVFSLWSGLGYYSRVRNLHATAKIIMLQFKGQFPRELDELKSLPGIGPSTAAAIASLAFNQPHAILDGNVKRVLTRLFAISGHPEQAKIKNQLWSLAHACMCPQRCAHYTQAIMDLGALCCTSKNPNCHACPLKTHCLAYIQKKPEAYPSKKIKKSVPVLAQQFLVLHDARGFVYLEKNPPVGIWGGLWCLPSLTDTECPLQYLYHKLALVGEAPKHLTTLKHRFTHLHLNINALSIKVVPIEHFIREARGQWFSLQELPAVGLAKPTTKILSQYISLTTGKCCSTWD